MSRPIQKAQLLAMALGQGRRLCRKCLKDLNDQDGPAATYHTECRPSKFKNSIVTQTWFGKAVKFHSKKEARRASELVLLAQQGKIAGLCRQVDFPIEVKGVKVATYWADFAYLDKERLDESGNPLRVVEDVKSDATRRTDYYRLKKRLMEAFYSPLTITEV